MPKPQVSVLTTVYNREKYLAACIESILASTFQDWELIVVDDGSVDNSVAIAKRYGDQDPRIKLVINKKNLGQFENRNYAATLAQGDYIKYVDSDDIIYPHGLEVMMDAARNFPNAGLIISHDKIHELEPYPIEMSSEQACYAFFFNKGFPTCGPSSTLIKRTDFERIKGFPKPYYVGTDVLLWLKIAQISSLVKIQPALNWYRQHEGQAIAAGLNTNEYLRLDYNYFSEYLVDSNTILSAENRQAAMTYLKKRQLRKIVRYAFSSGNLKEAYAILKYNKLTIKDLKYIF